MWRVRHTAPVVWYNSNCVVGSNYPLEIRESSTFWSLQIFDFRKVYVPIGSYVIVIGEPTPSMDPNAPGTHLFVPVVSPRSLCYFNEVYFNGDSQWLERLS